MIKQSTLPQLEAILVWSNQRGESTRVLRWRGGRQIFAVGEGWICVARRDRAREVGGFVPSATLSQEAMARSPLVPQCDGERADKLADVRSPATAVRRIGGPTGR